MIGSAIGSSTGLLFTSSDHIADRLIRRFTGSPTSHVAITLGEDRQTLLHAVPQGVIIEPRSTWMQRDKAWVVAEYEVLPDVSQGLKRVLGFVGERYDFLFPANYALAYFYRRTVGAPVRALYRQLRSSQTCAQLALLLDANCQKIPEWCGLEFDTVLPADLLKRADGPSFRRIR